MLSFIAFCVLLASAFAGVIWKGGAPERIVAGAFASAFLASMLVEPATSSRFDSVMAETLAIDFALLLVLAAVALKAERRWPLVAASLQLIIVLAHLVKWIDPRLFHLTYMLLTNIWPVLQIAVLIGGTISYRRSLARGMSVRSWSD